MAVTKPTHKYFSLLVPRLHCRHHCVFPTLLTLSFEQNKSREGRVPALQTTFTEVCMQLLYNFMPVATTNNNTWLTRIHTHTYALLTPLFASWHFLCCFCFYLCYCCSCFCLLSSLRIVLLQSVPNAMWCNDNNNNNNNNKCSSSHSNYHYILIIVMKQ